MRSARSAAPGVAGCPGSSPTERKPLSVETPSPYQATSAYLSHGCAATLGSPTITRAASTTSALRIGASLSIGAAEPPVASGVGHVRARPPVQLPAGLVCERNATHRVVGKGGSVSVDLGRGP